MELFHNTYRSIKVNTDVNAILDYAKNGILANAMSKIKNAIARGTNLVINRTGLGNLLAYNLQAGSLKLFAFHTSSSNSNKDQVIPIPSGKVSTFNVFKKEPPRSYQPDLSFDLVNKEMATIGRDIALDIISDANLTGKISNSIFITKDKTYRLVLFAFEGENYNLYSESLLKLKKELNNTLLEAGCIISKKMWI